MEDRCVICGEIIPEGRMVCYKCEKGDDIMGARGMVSGRKESSFGSSSVESSQNKKKKIDRELKNPSNIATPKGDRKK